MVVEMVVDDGGCRWRAVKEGEGVGTAAEAGMVMIGWRQADGNGMEGRRNGRREGGWGRRSSRPGAGGPPTNPSWGDWIK
ncbi:unnamed protein product [Spirodela intermedia]|uniref:Uncharacterized protein n=1 Tax=Spirodela intermedia TaxID=51605 RepID=A0A7I8IHN3_SPIIN|nr:unnamed protein product [Spirodela intermedia]CAA6656593.1 unnamed protein product [Spirodela intermedia]